MASAVLSAATAIGLKSTVPVYPLAGAIVTVEVEDPPAATVTLVAESENDSAGAVLEATVIVVDPDDAW